MHATAASVTPWSASRSSSSTIDPPVAISSSRTMARLPSTSPTIESMTTWSSPSRRLEPAATGRPSSRENWVASLALPRSGETTTQSSSSCRAEVVRQHAERREVVDGHREEPVHLRRVEVHRQHPVGAGGGDQVGDETPPERDPGGVLLVAARVGEVGDDRRDHRGGRAPGRVDHEQQLHERVLGRRHERLDDVDVALAAVREQLGLEAVVAEPADQRLRQAHPELVADPVGEGLVCRPREDDDLAHDRSLAVAARARARRPARRRAPTAAGAPPPGQRRAPPRSRAAPPGSS